MLLGGDVPDGEVQRMIDHSYSLVVAKMPRAARLGLEVEYGGDRLYGG